MEKSITYDTAISYVRKTNSAPTNGFTDGIETLIPDESQKPSSDAPETLEAVLKEAANWPKRISAIRLWTRISP